MPKTLLSSALGLLLTSASLTSFGAVADSQLENKLKAALIFKLGHYVTWSHSPVELNYCFVGDHSQEISAILEARLKKGKLKRAAKVVNKDSIHEVRKFECQVLFTDKIDSADAELYQELSLATLTIVGNAKALKYGPIASIEIVNGKPQLAVSKNNLRRSQIKIDTQVLAVVTFKD